MKQVISLSLAFLIMFMVPLNNTKAYFNDSVDILAESSLLVNIDNGQILIKKNSDKKMYPASLTKIITAIIVLENVQDIDGTQYTAKSDFLNEFKGINISNAGIKSGETLNVRQLLYAILLQSANEAANILADNVFNDRDEFISKMNERVNELGATNTNFVNAHGLFDENQYTTADDLYILTKHAMTIPVFNEISSSSSFDMPQTNKQPARRFTTTVLMQDRLRGGKYYMNYVKGIKTGSLSESGRCLVTTAKINGSSYMLVILNSPMVDENGTRYPDNKSFVDSINIYEWTKNNLKNITVAETDIAITEINIKLSNKNDFTLLYPADNFFVSIPKNSDESVVQKKITLNEGIKAPLKSGDILGKSEFLIFGDVVGSVDLKVGEDIDISYPLLVIDLIQNAFSSIWTRIIIVAVLIALFIYIYVTIKTNKQNMKRRKIKRSKKYKNIKSL
ncbi:MAG: D-alanyl-D-alanine carboxypeptidase family protein [Oscillospiraceae bacterium]